MGLITNPASYMLLEAVLVKETYKTIHTIV